MTSWGAERDKRTTSRSVITHGGSSLMPSHSQGAERRTERRAGRTGSRWALCALVIGGLAGATWLLTGSAAHAADRGEEPTGSSPRSVLHLAAESGYEPTVGDSLEAAVQPPESPAPTHHRRHAVTSMPTTPERMRSGPVMVPGAFLLDESRLGAVFHDEPGIDATPAGAPPGTTTGSPRTSGGTTAHRSRPMTAERVIELPAVLPPGAPEAPATVTGDVATPSDPWAERPGGPAVASVTAERTTSDNTSDDQAPAGVMLARLAKVQSRSQVDRPVPAARPASATIRSDVPGDDGPATRRRDPGAVSSLPAGEPERSSEAGSPAALTARFTSDAMDDHRLAVVSDVEARRNDAQAPAVSPE